MTSIFIGTLAAASLGCSFVSSTIIGEASRKRPVDVIDEAPNMANPVISGEVAHLVEGRAVQAPDETTIHGQEFGVAMARYRDDTLCLTFMTSRESGRSTASRFDPDLQDNYQLVAPSERIDPERAPFVVASAIQPTSFAGRYDHTRVDADGDALQLTNRYRVAETWDVCFDNVSRVLTSRSRYALVRFRDDEGKRRFAYAWRFGADAVRTAGR